jgi:hypothetical protein
MLCGLPQVGDILHEAMEMVKSMYVIAALGVWGTVRRGGAEEATCTQAIDITSSLCSLPWHHHGLSRAGGVMYVRCG